MRARIFFLVLAVFLVTGLAVVQASETRLPWVLIGFLGFIGIVVFDSYQEIPKSWTNSALFILIYGLTLQSCLESTPDNFWRDQAGAVFLATILFEQNSLPWSGLGFFRSTMAPSVLYFLLVLAQTLPFFSADVVFGCALGAILLFSFLELFSILRENNDRNSGSFMSAIRSGVCGLGSLFYSATFLPGTAKEAPFVFIRVGLPLLGLAVATLSLFFRQWRRRYILFCCNWSVFVFWAAITGEAPRFYAAVAAFIAGVWTIMMTNRRAADASDTRDLYLKLSAWGVPGSLMFSMIVFALFPSESLLVREGSVLWLVTFFVYWSGLRKFELPKKQGEASAWTWRNSLALSITIAGAGLLAGAKYFPEIITQVLGQSWGVIK